MWNYRNCCKTSWGSKIKKASLSKIIQLFQIISVEILNQIPNSIGSVRSTFSQSATRIILFLLSYLNLSILMRFKKQSPNLSIKKTTKWRILTGSCSKIKSLGNIIVLGNFGFVWHCTGEVVTCLKLEWQLQFPWKDNSLWTSHIPPSQHTHTPIPRVNVDLFSKFLWNGHQTLSNHNIDNNNEGFIYEGVAVMVNKIISRAFQKVQLKSK